MRGWYVCCALSVSYTHLDRGGIVPATYPGRQVRIKTKNGEVYGVVEAYRDLFKEENLGTKHFLIDIGAKDREDALKNVSLGDPIVPDTHIRKMKNGKFTARALDDRLGVYIIMEAIKMCIRDSYYGNLRKYS